MLLCTACENALVADKEGYSCNHCGKTYEEKSGITHFGQTEDRSQDYFPESAFEILYAYEENNFWFRTRNKIIGSLISRHLPKNSRILETGCGTGYVSRHLKKLGYLVECADLFEEALQFCRERNAGMKYYQCNLTDRIVIGEFDGVCAFDVLEHIEDDTRALQNLCDAVKEGGFLVITVPADNRLWSSIDCYAGHKRRYDKGDLRIKIEKTGLNIIQLKYFMTFLYPIVLLSRKVAVHTSQGCINRDETQIQNRILYELQPPRILNLLFFIIFSLEAHLVPLVEFPFGSSLFCVAQKVKCS